MADLFPNSVIKKILEKYKPIWAIGNLYGIANWDVETYMPQKGIGARGEAMAQASSLSQKLFLDKDFVELIHKAEEEANLNDSERGVVRELTHSLKIYEKLPKEFLEEFERTTSSASVVWRKAKENNDFSSYEPLLTKIFEMSIKKAEYLGYTNSPYDALLDIFEEDLKDEDVSTFIGTIKTPLQDLLTKIKGSPKYFEKHPLEEVKYERHEMEKVNDKVLKFLWGDEGNLRLDVSSHPFTTSFSPDDVRITTWYHDVDFARSVLGVVHEFGHALYDLQSDKGLEFTPVQSGVSLVIHESQSRFWENFVGLNKGFINKFLPDFKKAVGRELSLDEVYSYFNKVKPGVLRTEADEVTYHFHVILRYEIEKDCVEGRLKVKDIPEVWRQKMKDYLGIEPSTDKEGVLQDMHWSDGSIGYFPTYMIGTFLSGVWKENLEKDLGSMDSGELDGKKIGSLQKWLKDHIHDFGATYTLKDLLKKNNFEFSPKSYLNYLQNKYLNIFN